MSIENLSIEKNQDNLVHSDFNQFQSTQPHSLDIKVGDLQNQRLKQSSSQQPPKLQQEPTVDYKYPQFIEYFQSKEIYSKKWKEMSNSLLCLTEFEVNNQIKSGFLKISNQKKQIGKATDAQPLQDANKVKDILLKKSKLEEQLKSIQQELEKIGQNKDQKEQKEQKKDKTSQIQHKKFIQRMIKVRKFAQEKRKAMLQYQKEKVMKEIKKQGEERKLSQQKIKEQREKSIKKKLEEKQKQKKKQLELQKDSMKRYKQVFQKKRNHEIMKQKYETSLVLPILQQQKQILKDRSSRFKGYSIEQIRNFEKQYDKSRQQRISQLSNGSKSTWQYKPPSYSPRIYKILQEQKMKQKIRLEQQKRALQQKLERKSNYAQYVKESISIKIDQKKKLQLLLLNKPKEIKKVSNIQKINIGNKYLREGRNAKSELRKANYSQTQLRQQKTEASKQEKKKSNTTLNHIQHEVFIRQANKDRINKIISSKSIEKIEKIQKLKVQAKKINERIKRKEQLKKLKPRNEEDDNIQQLLASIKAKVGIVDLLKE